MGTSNRKARSRTAPRAFGRRGLPIVIAGMAVVSIGIGIASAQGSSARTQALRQAQGVAAGMPAAKASLYQQGVARAFPAKPAAKPVQASAHPVAAPGVPVVVGQDSRITGIAEMRQAPFPSADFAVQNSYSGPVHGRWYVAYAGTVGGAGATARQGGLRIMSADAEANTHIATVGTFPAPGTESLKVIAYSGSQITLLTDTGATLKFDLSTLSYQ